MSGWVRLWHDMPTDPKWRAIARKSGQPLPCVIALFTLLMTNAGSNNDGRGSLNGWDNEDAAAALDMDEADVAAIIDAMQGKVISDNSLTGWDKRQPKREDAGVGARVAKHRANKAERDVTQCNAPDSDSDSDSDKDDASASLRAPDQPIGEAFDVYNEVAASAGWPRVERRTDGRQATLRTRLREDGLDGWRDALNRARASPFLGSDPPPSFVSFDWLTKPANLAKLIEGNYDRGHQSNIREINPNSTLAAILRSEAEAEREGFVDYPETRPALPTKLIGRG